MGNSCSSGQAHKSKDNVSQRSEESESYQIRSSLPTEQQQILLNHTSGVILEPSTAGQAPQQVAAVQVAPVPERKPHLSRVVKAGGPSMSADSVSLSSPPGTQSPKEFVSEIHVPKEVASLSEHLQSLIMGRITQCRTISRTRKIVIYVCAADSQDCCVEKGTLHNHVYPILRETCRSKGYELHIVDLHWRSLLEKQQDHEFPELCIGELIRQMEVAYIIPMIFLNNSLGTPLLPITIESADFRMALESIENHEAQLLLSKWYQLDSDAQPPCYRLQPISSHIPGLQQNSTEARERAFEEWRSEIERMLAVLTTTFSQELRDTYLTTVVEQEVHNTVFMSQELAKRCIWVNRIYIPVPKTPEEMGPGEAELHRRLKILQKDLKTHLAEKHIVRIPVKYVEGGLQTDNEEHAAYIAEVSTHLKKHMTEMINVIIEEHQTKISFKPGYGIEATLFEELNQQTIFCQKAAQCSINREKTLEEIKNYITGDANYPLVLYGPGGCGKTTLLARVAQCLQHWQPEAFLIFRFVGISAQSSTIEQLLSSITNQCSILAHGRKCCCGHSISQYTETLPNLLAATCLQRPLVILLDGIDQVREYSSKSIDWLPMHLPDNVKLMLTVSENTELHVAISDKLGSSSKLIEMPLLGEQEARGILMSSVMQYNHSVNSRIQDCVLKSVQECTLPLYSKVLAWQTSWWTDKEHDIVPKGHVDDQLSLMLEELEQILGQVQVQHALALITAAKHGVTDSEMIDLLAFDDTFHSGTTHVVWAPACLAWSRLNKHLAPFFQWSLTGGSLGVQWKDDLLRQAVTRRYQKYLKWASQMIYDYYNEQWAQSRPASVVGRVTSQEAQLGTGQAVVYNRRKLDELPYQYFKIKGEIENSLYCSDINWIYHKVCGSNCFQVLEDLNMKMRKSLEGCKSRMSSTSLLRNFLESEAAILNYDGRQFYSFLYTYIRKNGLSPDNYFKLPPYPPVVSLLSMNSHLAEGRCCDAVLRLPETDRFVVSVSSERGELCVWDLELVHKVRTIGGVSNPTSLVPIDKFRCIVLCGRELEIYDLDRLEFVMKLKGLMNQKMPYFALHDRSHVVVLSRNRMYVNLTNLETGVCVTTFKAGEDRFLNSLLVSGDGRVLVCGDETQKPFPLLVWNLQSRKLMYDLRIPHHDFITALSAITFEGNYVCCACREVEEPNPNFIVVYDLQSGTLFKKWKPSCNTVSIEISSQGGCVVSGLEDARILVWDLITGNCRCSLTGHTAPITSLKLDPTGSVCLSTDSECRDRAIRLWDLNKGNLIAVYTPKANIKAFELTSNGSHVILVVEGYEDLVVLKLVGVDRCEEIESDNKIYGTEENNFRAVQVKKSSGGQC